MAKETDGLLLTASLNIEETANIIKKEDIAKLNNKLANDDTARVKIVGGLDLSKTQSLIQSQIATISKNLKLNIGQIDFKGIGNTQNITNSFNNIQTQANNVTNSLTNLADEFKKPIRAKGFETVKIDTGNNIDKFINSINNSKVPIQAMQSEIDNLTSSFAKLDAIEDQAEKSSALTNILNTLDNAKTKFQSLKELFQGVNKVDWLTVNSEQITKIDDMATKIAICKNNLSATRDEWKSQGIYVGEIQAKATSLARSLSNIKKPEKFNEWLNEWTTLNQKATQLKANLDSQVVVQNKIYETQTKIASLNPTNNAEEISLLNSKLETQKKELSNLRAQANAYTELLSREEREQYITEQTAKARENLAIANAKSNDKATVQRTSEMNSYKESIDKVISQLNVLNNSTVFVKNSSNPQVSQIKQQVTQLITEYQTLKTTLNGNLTPNDIPNVLSKFKELETQFQQVIISAKNLKSSISANNSMQRQAQNAELLVEKVKKLRSEIIAYQNANSKAMKSQATSSNGITYSAEIDGFLAKLKNASSVTDAEFKKISASFRTLKAEIKSAGLEGGTMLNSLWTNIKKFTSWMSMTFLISRFTMEIRQAVVELKEIDTILTEISKTSDRTTESLANLGKTSFDTASRYGQKASDFLTGVQEMSRAGFGEIESEQMAELSTLAQSAGDMTSELANEYLIATNAAYQFNGSLSALTNVLDSQNYVTNRNAVNLTELANATKIAGSQSASSAVGIDKMTAAVGTMIASTQEGGEIAGRAFKAIVMNLQQIKAEADDIGDGGEAITSDSLTKYEKACADFGVSLKTVKDGVLSLRDPMQILEELADAVSKEAEGSVKVANLINAVGGKYRGNQLISLLRNWDTYKKMLSEFNSNEAIGSAAEEAQKTAESWQGVLNSLENDWSEFVNSVINSDMAKSVIESAKRIIDTLSDASSPLNFILTQIANLLELVTKLTDKIGVIPTILGGLTLKNAGKLNS